MSGDPRILTVWQPWATLLALGVKRVETRPWSASYRGPVVIHAAARPPDDFLRLGPGGFGAEVVSDEYLVNEMADGSFRLLDLCNEESWRLPLGAVVGVAELVDVLPVEACSERRAHLCRTVDGGLLHHAPLDAPFAGGETERVLDREVPFGDFTEGRFGWIFEGARVLDRPVWWKGAQGLRRVPEELARWLVGVLGA